MSIRFSTRRGSTITLTIIVSVIMTSLLAAMSWVAGEAAQRTAGLSKLDQAFYAAEAASQRVLWYCKQGQMSSITSPLTGSLNGYNYSVSWTTGSGTTINVTALGSVGSTSYTLSQAMTPPSAMPTIATGGDFENKNIDVTGNVTVGAAYSNGGSGSLDGDLTYYGSASSTGSVSGTVTHATGSFSTMDMTTLGTTLVAAAGTNTYTGNQSSKTFDFTAISGPNKVIYVNGNVTSPTFVGTGTLYVKGTVSVGGFGSAANPVNIVATGDLTTSNNVTMYGALYTGGEWYRGKFSLTGLIYAATAIEKSNNGHSSLTQTSAPWFDPRGSGNAGTTLSVTGFSGPQP